MTPLGETLRRARLSKGITFEDAERVTRISRKYLEALELENFGILPAPVFARGFLRSYADYLGLDPAELLPFFPVGHVDEPTLEPLPEVSQPRTWNASGLIAAGVVASLILLVIALYTVGHGGRNPSLSSDNSTGAGQNQAPLINPAPESNGTQVGPAAALPDLVGLSLADAIAQVEATGASYIVVGVQEGDVPEGQIVDQRPSPGATVGAGDVVTLVVRR